MPDGTIASPPCCGACGSAAEHEARAGKPRPDAHARLPLRVARGASGGPEGVTIRVRRCDATVDEHRVEKGVIVVGRGKSADVVVPDVVISRSQCRFTFHEDGTVTIEDLKSACGTVIDGMRIDRATVREGDRIFIGDSILELHVGG